MAQVETDRPTRRRASATPSAVSGLSILLTANSSNFGSMFVILEPFDERRKPELQRERDHGPAAQRVTRSRVNDADGQRLRRAAGPGLGVAGGFKLMVEDRGDAGLDDSAEADRSRWSRELAQAAAAWSACSRMFRSNTPQLSWTSTAPRSSRWACRSTTSTRPCRSISARSTSTTSTPSAATGR